MRLKNVLWYNFKYNKSILTLSTFILLKAAWRTLKLCINSCSSLAWNLTFFRRIQPGNSMSMNWQYAAPVKQKSTAIISIFICSGFYFQSFISSPTWTELFDLRVGEMQRIVDPCQHVMSAQVVNRHRCGIHIHCHPLPGQNNTKRWGEKPFRLSLFGWVPKILNGVWSTGVKKKYHTPKI